jgi:hypothetical protein
LCFGSHNERRSLYKSIRSLHFSLSILKRSTRGSPVRASNSQQVTFEHVKKPTGIGSPRGYPHTRQAQGRGRYPFRRVRRPRSAYTAFGFYYYCITRSRIVWSSDNALDSNSGGCSVRISTETPAVMTEAFVVFLSPSRQMQGCASISP